MHRTRAPRLPNLCDDECVVTAARSSSLWYWVEHAGGFGCEAHHFCQIRTRGTYTPNIQVRE